MKGRVKVERTEKGKEEKKDRKKEGKKEEKEERRRGVGWSAVAGHRQRWPAHGLGPGRRGFGCCIVGVVVVVVGVVVEGGGVC